MTRGIPRYALYNLNTTPPAMATVGFVLLFRLSGWGQLANSSQPFGAWGAGPAGCEQPRPFIVVALIPIQLQHRKQRERDDSDENGEHCRRRRWMDLGSPDRSTGVAVATAMAGGQASKMPMKSKLFLIAATPFRSARRVQIARKHGLNVAQTQTEHQEYVRQRGGHSVNGCSWCRLGHHGPPSPFLNHRAEQT